MTFPNAQPLFGRTLPLAGMLAAFHVTLAGDPADGDGELDSFDTLRDPTVLSSRLGAGNEYGNQHHDAFRNKLTLSGAYAFGTEGRRDWMVSAELPFLHDEPGDTADNRETGVGDFKLGAGHVFDGTGRLRWGLGGGVTFDTASSDQLGDGAIKLSPKWGGGFRFTEGFELIANAQYNASVHEASERNALRTLEVNPALLDTWPHYWYSLVGYDNTWDFENDSAHGAKVKAELGKGFGPRQRWVAHLGVDVPVVRTGRDNFTLKAGIHRVF